MRSLTKIVQPSNLTIATTSQFQTEIRHAIESGVDVVLVDLKNITSVTSASFLVLVKGLKLAHKSNCQLLICSANAQLKMMFELTGLDQVFKVLTDSHEALQYVQPANKLTRLETVKAA